jgi:hypothetical protein
MPINATPIVPAVPQDVPIINDVIEQIRSAVTRKIAGFKIARP